MNFWASLEYAVGVMIGSCSLIGVVGAKYHNHYAQIVMVGISATDAAFQGHVIGMEPTLDCNDLTIIATGNNKLVSSSLVLTIFLVTQGTIELGDTVV